MSEMNEIKANFEEINMMASLLKEAETKTERKMLIQKRARRILEMQKKLKLIKAPLTPTEGNAPSKENTKKLRDILTWERQRKLISTPDEYTLNMIEYKGLESKKDSLKALCKAKAPAGLRVTMGDEYYFTKYHDESKNKTMFITYNPIIISPEEQITNDLEWQLKNGFHPKQSEYPPAKTIVRRFILNESQWKQFFEETI